MTELLPLNNSRLPVRLRFEDYLRLDEAGPVGERIAADTIKGLAVETKGLGQ